MKKYVLVTLLMVGFGWIANAQDADTEKAGVVNVVGEAQMTLTPDYIEIYIVAEELSSDPASAQQAVVKEMENILSLLKSHPDVEKLQTRLVELQPRMQHQQEKMEYYARQMLSFRLTEVEQYDELMLSLLEKGIDGITNLSFRSTEEEKLEQALLRRAVSNARDKASLLAQELGQSLGKAVYVSDHSPAQGPRPMAMEMKSSSQGSSIAPGEIEISKSVNVQFQLK